MRKESILLDSEYILFFRLIVSRFSRSILPFLPFKKSLQLILLICASLSILIDCELYDCTLSPSPLCSFINLYSIEIGASSPTISLQGLILTLIISHLSRKTWFSFIRENVSFYCFSMWLLRPSIFYRSVEFAAIRSRIIAIDSMISFADFRVLPFPEPLLSRCSYVF